MPEDKALFAFTNSCDRTHFARDSELKVYKDILKACVHAFNLLPNTRLGFQGFNNTYALASKIDSLLDHEKKNI